MISDNYSGDPYMPRDLNAAGVTVLVGVLLLAAIGGLIYIGGPSDLSVATNDSRPPITQQPSARGSSLE